MLRPLLFLLLLAGCLPQLAAQEKGSTAGIKVALIPEAVYAHVTVLKAGQGLMVEHVDKESTAFRAGLRKWDLLMQWNGTPVLGDAGAVASMEKSLNDAATKPTPLLVLRANRMVKLTYPGENSVTAKATAKPDGPPTVSVQAQPMGDNKLQITIFYYGEDSSKLRHVTCTGTLKEITDQVQSQASVNRMSDEVLDLVNTALSRLRELQKKE